MARKPGWVIAKERGERREGDSVWLFGLHAVREALENPARRCLHLVVTPNAANRLADAIARADIEPRHADPRRFDAPLEPGSVHQGAALKALPLDWGSIEEACAPGSDTPIVMLLDRVTDPHNVGAILRSAEVFGARAVVAPHRHSAPETGALAKAASGALERQPYCRVPNLAAAMAWLREMGYQIIGLDGKADVELERALSGRIGPVALVLGAEGPGLRPKTRSLCDRMARISGARAFGSLNVSTAAAVSLYAATMRRQAG